MINLDTERMEGIGADGGHNLLGGLNDLCEKYIEDDMRILELGCHKGVSSELFAHHALQVHTCDAQECPSRLDKLPNVIHHQGSFKEILKTFDKESFDFIYLDGMHDREAVIEDLKSTIPLLKRGALIGGHDYYTGVKDAIKEVLGIEPEIFSDSSWIIRLATTKLYENVKEEDLYTWPNPNFPLKCILNTEKHRVFILSDLTHNYNWLKSVKPRDEDVFFVTFGWFLSEHLATQADWMFNKINLNKKQFYLMYNSPEEKRNGDRLGFEGSIINNNAWLDERVYSIRSSTKKYDALYIGRPVTFKRHHLARKIDNLALLAGDSCHGTERSSLPKCKNDPFKFLDKAEISEICAQAHCGLILSEEEGACFASSEYLLCGIPVVSTESKGGRDFWYNENNSIICDPNERSVKNATELASLKEWNPRQIRENHIKLMHETRDKFNSILTKKIPNIDPSRFQLDLPRRGIDWYCNENSSATPHLRDVESYFTK